MNNSSKKRVIYSSKWIAYTAMLTALVVATGYIPGIPVLDGKIYWCDFVIFMSAYLLDPLAAAIVGGIGTTFFDLFGINGTAYNAIPSLLIHGVQGAMAAAIFMLLKCFFNKQHSNKREIVIALISSILPAVWVILGYFVKRITWEGKIPADALLKMPANVLQEIIGIAVAMIICYATTFKKQLEKAHLLPDFKGEMLQREKLKKTEEQTAAATTEEQSSATDEGQTAAAEEQTNTEN